MVRRQLCHGGEVAHDPCVSPTLEARMKTRRMRNLRRLWSHRAARCGARPPWPITLGWRPHRCWFWLRAHPSRHTRGTALSGRSESVGCGSSTERGGTATRTCADAPCPGSDCYSRSGHACGNVDSQGFSIIDSSNLACSLRSVARRGPYGQQSRLGFRVHWHLHHARVLHRETVPFLRLLLRGPESAP